MRKFLVTSGGTQVKIDDVRHLGNMSSGKFGGEIAEELLKKGQSVTYLGSQDGREPFDLRTKKCLEGGFLSRLYHCAKRIWQKKKYSNKLIIKKYKTYEEYKVAVLYDREEYDVIVLAAAVSDYTVEPIAGKMDSHASQEIKLIPAEKVISKIREESNATIVGFKLVCSTNSKTITDEEKWQAAQQSIQTNGCDMVVLNDLYDIRKGKHSLNIYYPNRIGYTRLYREKLAARLVELL